MRKSHLTQIPFAFNNAALSNFLSMRFTCLFLSPSSLFPILCIRFGSQLEARVGEHQRVQKNFKCRMLHSNLITLDLFMHFLFSQYIYTFSEVERFRSTDFCNSQIRKFHVMVHSFCSLMFIRVWRCFFSSLVFLFACKQLNELIVVGSFKQIKAMK